MTSLVSKTVCIISIVLATSQAGNLGRPDRGAMTLRKFECTSTDFDVVKDIKCFNKPIRNKFGNLTVTMTLTKPVDQVWLNVSSFTRVSTNIYQRGRLYFRKNLCTFGKDGFTSLLFKVSPGILKFLNPDVIKCPITEYSVKNVIADRVDPTFFLTFMATGDYMLVLTLIDGHTDKIVTAIEISVAFKGLSTYLIS